MNQEIHLMGLGSVSPFGWGMSAWPAGESWEGSNLAVPDQTMDRPGHSIPLDVKRVPAPETALEFKRHPRYRRVSAISRFAASATLEAIDDSGEGDLIREGQLKLGIVFTVMSGSVNYSRRFYEEVLEDPATASPLLFPETVFNAPSSHLSTYLTSTSPNYTLVGDSSVWALGLAMGAEWLTDGVVDRVVVVAAEEMDWLTADAFKKFSKTCRVSEGAAAVLLGNGSNPTITAQRSKAILSEVTTPQPHLSDGGRLAATLGVRNEFRSLELAENSILIDGRQGVKSWDRAEDIAWQDWEKARFSPKKWTGEALTASVGWQTILGARALSQGAFREAIISSPGINHQSAGIRLRSSS